MDRSDAIARLTQPNVQFDLLVIGGGATGASIALDAATRGLRVLLLERSDFGKGTSSRSTKLVHGGVRYLAQGNVALVRDALLERSRLAINAPHVVHERSFLVPCRGWLEFAWYRLGFVVYDLLAARSGFSHARSMNHCLCMEKIPTLRAECARHGVLYSDGQFDDARLLLDILRTAVDHGATVVNYIEVMDLIRLTSGRIHGVRCMDLETGQTHEVAARCVVNATGPFCDAVRCMDEPQSEAMVAASQGVHIVLPREFLPGETALMIPKTSDGRVLFLIPWQNHVVVGTSDTPIPDAVVEPKPQDAEIEFLLNTSARYLTRVPTRADVLSVFTGIRPLVRPTGAVGKTSALARDHTILVSSSGLVTITGGKWTTARKMGEDCVDRCIQQFGLPAAACQTADLPLRDRDRSAEVVLVQSQPELGNRLVPSHELTGAEVIAYVRNEMARTVEDILARRSRMLFLDVAAALAAAPRVAQLIAVELDRDAAWCDRQLEAFSQVASSFRIH